MKFSYNWITELVPGLHVPPATLSQLITMHTAESEGHESWGDGLDRVVAARVLSADPIAGSHNVLASIDAGPAYGRLQVVCGAPNCRAGLLTAYVPPGTQLKGKFIGEAVISGIVSAGMLASGAEVGINGEKDGILELDGLEPGQPLPRCRPDAVIEVDNKSLNHRPDLWGHEGMAREVAACTGLSARSLAGLTLIPDAPAAWGIAIEEPVLCPRYSALVFENVTVAESPLWLQARLEAVGLNPISNIVDVTNYVMAELAQPMHAFDAAKLRGSRILVRRAAAGETLDALNGESYTLASSHLVIADEEGPVALAGIIGGAGSAIGPSTTRIVLESANFLASSIRRTSTDLKLRTDASMRFEKAQDPVNTVRALARAVELLREVSPGIRLVGGLVDLWFPAAPLPPISLPMDWLVRKLGRSIPSGEVKRILEALQFKVEEPEAGRFLVSVPSWRATKDISIADDLLEEVGRMVGYDTIPPTPPLQPAERPWVNRERQFHHEFRKACTAQGYTETQNYSFISDEMARRFSMDPGAHLRVANPINSENGLMRMSLLPGLHRNMLANQRFFDEFRLFEVGKEIHKREGALPEEITHLMTLNFARAGDGQAQLFEAKRLAECLLPGCETRPAEPRVFEHPARAAAITWRGVTLGRLFELHPLLVENGRAALLDIDLDAVFRLGPEPRRYTPLRRYPASPFDLSVVAGLRVLSADVEAVIRESAGSLCDQVEFLYSYRGAPLPEDRQSLTYRITVSAPDKTLSSEDVASIRAAVMEKVRQAGYELRA